MSNTLIKLSRKPQLVARPSGPLPEARTACIRTFGCQMNVHDSDRMRRMILDAGYA
jgi:tRNA-2-methylthio-N6-dimethylallyladenosine synthase